MAADDHDEPPLRPPIADEALRQFPRVVAHDGHLYLSCSELISFLFEYLPEDLTQERRIEFERHLARCASCRDYLATYRATIVLAHGAFADDEPALVELPNDLYRAIRVAT